MMILKGVRNYCWICQASLFCLSCFSEFCAFLVTWHLIRCLLMVECAFFYVLVVTHCSATCRRITLLPVCKFVVFPCRPRSSPQHRLAGLVAQALRWGGPHPGWVDAFRGNLWIASVAREGVQCLHLPGQCQQTANSAQSSGLSHCFWTGVTNPTFSMSWASRGRIL